MEELLGAKLRDVDGILWEVVATDDLERWCVGLKPISKKVDGRETPSVEILQALHVLYSPGDVADPLNHNHDHEFKVYLAYLIVLWKSERVLWIDDLGLKRLTRELPAETHQKPPKGAKLRDTDGVLWEVVSTDAPEGTGLKPVSKKVRGQEVSSAEILQQLRMLHPLFGYKADLSRHDHELRTYVAGLTELWEGKRVFWVDDLELKQLTCESTESP